VNQRQIEVFHAVMTTGTASRAAEVLRISQPAVSKAIQELERSVGFALFDRKKGRMVPTPEAQLFESEVEASFIGMAHLRTSAARIRDFGSGEIRITSLSALSTNIVPTALSAFRKKHPLVAITFQTHMSSIVRDLVAAGHFDLGIAADEVDVAGVITRPFMTNRACIALYPGHPLEHLDVITPADLHGQEFIALAPEDTTRMEVDRIFARESVQPRIVLETPFSTTVCAMVQAKLGCGLIQPLTAEMYVNHGVILKPFKPEVHFRALLLFPPNRRPSRILQDYIAELHRAVSKVSVT
jgi:DNA-binding transcriptional LysR family regulator